MESGEIRANPVHAADRERRMGSKQGDDLQVAQQVGEVVRGEGVDRPAMKAGEDMRNYVCGNLKTNCGNAEYLCGNIPSIPRNSAERIQGEQVGAEAADDKAGEDGGVVRRQQSEDGVDRKGDQAVERGHGLKSQVGAGGIVQDRARNTAMHGARARIHASTTGSKRSASRQSCRRGWRCQAAKPEAKSRPG